MIAKIHLVNGKNIQVKSPDVEEYISTNGPFVIYRDKKTLEKLATVNQNELAYTEFLEEEKPTDLQVKTQKVLNIIEERLIAHNGSAKRLDFSARHIIPNVKNKTIDFIDWDNNFNYFFETSTVNTDALEVKPVILEVKRSYQEDEAALIDSELLADGIFQELNQQLKYFKSQLGGYPDVVFFGGPHSKQWVENDNWIWHLTVRQELTVYKVRETF